MAEVIITPEAIADILAIYDYIHERDCEEQAEAILSRIEQKTHSLSTLPMRGKFPEELIPFGNVKIREIQEVPWRIFYRPENDVVFVLSVLDGRRNMPDLLLERLIS